MLRIPFRWQPGAAAVVLSLVPSIAVAQDSREAMWPAPTAEDWKKPVLIQWQRTWDDAVAVARETGKPILVCVNMDGEIASEHYAGIRYRQPEIAKLYEPYVTVMASVYRHNARDFDEQGRRIPCPRFGCVTCGEHIAIEPILFRKFMDGERVAPRHIMVELDENGQDSNAAETYDVYYAFDTDSVFQAIGDGIKNRARQPKVISRGDRSILERVASPDSNDKTAVEQAFFDGDRATKEKILEAAVAAGDNASIDLLRLAVFGLDVEHGKLARKALAMSLRGDAADVINEALRVPLPKDERDALIGALTKIGEKSPQAKKLAVVHKGLSGSQAGVDVRDWTEKMSGSTYPAPAGFDTIETAVEEQARTAATQPKSPEAQLELAESTLLLAVDPKNAALLAKDPRTAADFSQLQFQDAYRAGVEAERLGASGWRVDAVIGLSAYYLERLDEAYSRAEKAAKAMPPGAEGWTGMATLALFAVARQKAIGKKIMAKENWPPEWLSDVNAAYSVLAKHPLGTALQVVEHYDFIEWLGARGKAARVLEAGLQRFPDAWQLHDRMRGQVLRDRGARGLEPAYETMIQKHGATPNLRWFAGYASIVAAEFLRRRGHDDDAVASYDRAIRHFENSIAGNPSSAATSDHYIAVALGGKARIAYENDEDRTALDALIRSFARRPDAAATLDGLNISAVDTAKMLRQRLRDKEAKAMVAELQAAMDRLDPKMLELPAYETGGAPSPDAQRAARRRRGR